MRVMWKFALGAYILYVSEQGHDICAWAPVDPLQPVEDRRFVVVGTGRPMPEVGDYVGTAMLEGGALVFHVFDAVSS